MFLVNDWQIKNCLWLVLSSLVAILGLIGLAALGFDIPGLRQIAGFVFLTFIPGILILRILRIHSVSIIEALVYSVGLSLASVMFIGALINFALPFIGISKPISLVPVTAALVVFMLILMPVAYIRDRDFLHTEKRALAKKLQLPSILFLVFLLLLTVLGVAVIDAYQNNVLLLITMLAIAGIVGLAAFGKFIQAEVYPLAIFIIGLCLLYETTLMSPYLIGTDIWTEYNFYHPVAVSGFWNASTPSIVNSCLSITMLAPVYSLLLNIDGIWVFKAVYPLLFALVPLMIFHIFSQQMSQKKAFLAVFFFMAVPTFSLEMIALCRQQIAEFFFALVVLLLVDRVLRTGQKLTLLIIFSVAIIVSHYSFGFIGFIYMGLSLPFVFLMSSNAFRKAWGWLTARFGGLPQSLVSTQALPAKMLIAVVAIYFIAGFAWYGFVASGVNLNLISSLLTGQTGIITAELSKIATKPLAFFNFSQSDVLIQTALGFDFFEASLQGKFFRVLQYITQLFLMAGFLRLVFRPKDLRFTPEYIALSVISVLVILACIFLPGFAIPFNTSRWYHIALITLAPFCILGGEAIWLGISSLWHRLRHAVQNARYEKAEDNQAYLKFVTVAILIPYFLFTSGSVYEVTKQDVTDKIDTPYSIALSSYRLDLAGVFYWQDGAAAQWLVQDVSDNANIYVDDHTQRLPSFYQFHGQLTSLLQPADQLLEDGYIYFTAWNTYKRQLTFGIRTGLRKHISFDDVPWLDKAIETKNRIYNNGGSQILAPREDL